ncbi:hypothetical protein RFI_28562, partial [Reticulomyxa filosa]
RGRRRRHDKRDDRHHDVDVEERFHCGLMVNTFYCYERDQDKVKVSSAANSNAAASSGGGGNAKYVAHSNANEPLSFDCITGKQPNQLVKKAISFFLSYMCVYVLLCISLHAIKLNNLNNDVYHKLKKEQFPLTNKNAPTQKQKYAISLNKRQQTCKCQLFLFGWSIKIIFYYRILDM